MRRIVSHLMLTIILLGSQAAMAKSAPPISADELAAISARGRALYEYDQAAWHSSDALMALHPPQQGLGRYICQKTSSGWIVAFGKLNESRDAFLIAYTATEGADLEHFSIMQSNPPRSDTAFFLASAKAIDLALKNFQGVHRAYNAAVLPAPENRLFVYIFPAQTKDNVYPLGGDSRFTLSGDGSAIIEERHLHKSILESSSAPDGGRVEAGFHNHVLSEVPEDTDVFYVLTRRPLVPEYVGTQKWMYIVQTTGLITWEKVK